MERGGAVHGGHSIETQRDVLTQQRDVEALGGGRGGRHPIPPGCVFFGKNYRTGQVTLLYIRGIFWVKGPPSGRGRLNLLAQSSRIRSANAVRTPANSNAVIRGSGENPCPAGDPALCYCIRDRGRTSCKTGSGHLQKTSSLRRDPDGDAGIFAFLSAEICVNPHKFLPKSHCKRMFDMV